MDITNESLMGKAVLNKKGDVIGSIQGSIKDDISGEITSVLVKPYEGLDLTNYSLTEHGEILFPFSSLSSVKNIFIIEELIK